MKQKKFISSQKMCITSCFFCDKLVMSSDAIYLKECYERLQKLIGTIPERFGGKIGNKIICMSCVNDIEIVLNIAKEDISVYATKYKECRMCGAGADCTHISQINGLCQSCQSNEEYYEHEHRVSGD